ncbi:MAG: substrate-binding domain-containing protein, partial [Methylobacteriaceae bacterium]|nr:substrate-binding domain-containing protein [Methylobacteriaceae bacterium]
MGLAVAAGTSGLMPGASTEAQAAGKKLTILASVPDLAFPFFVHMMGQIKAEGDKLGDIEVVVADGQRSSPKQTADVEAAITKGVDGIVISPNEVNALAPA